MACITPRYTYVQGKRDGWKFWDICLYGLSTRIANSIIHRHCYALLLQFANPLNQISLIHQRLECSVFIKYPLALFRSDLYGWSGLSQRPNRPRASGCFLIDPSVAGISLSPQGSITLSNGRRQTSGHRNYCSTWSNHKPGEEGREERGRKTR